MARQTSIYQLIPQLSDLELLLLICLIADNHCIVRAAEEDLNDVQRDVTSISHSLFGFSCTTIDCNPDTTLEDLSNAVLEDAVPSERDNHERASSVAFRSSRSRSPAKTNTLDERKTCNLIIARNLDQTDRNVQVQALELMRSRRIYSRYAAHATPKRFLFVALLDEAADGPPFLTPHLNDQMFVSHECTTFEDSASGNKHPTRTPSTSSLDSATSVLRRPSPYKRPSIMPHLGYRNPDPPISEAHLMHLAHLVSKVRPSATISRHIHNIPTHLRLHRHVKGGVSAVATRHLNLLSRILAVLQLPADASNEAESNLPVVTPTLVGLAATKVYAHRVEVVKRPEDERSMQWGSDYDAVAEQLRGASVERCINETVLRLEVPA